MSFKVRDCIELVRDVASGLPDPDEYDPELNVRRDDELGDDDEGYPMSMWDPQLGWIDV